MNLRGAVAIALSLSFKPTASSTIEPITSRYNIPYSSAEPNPLTTLTVSLPEALTAYLQEQIASGHYSTADDYIQTLIQQDKERKTQLEPPLLKGLASGDPTPMTAADWNTIRATVQQKLGDRPSNG